ncbi:hypothetical protein PCASD_17726 [Puccinia coronata f. sp. avenae]|uniref:Uncharacterized protein n=1 Tax=Puccinia coronata f. sp. avenae TaxID=200324 RepID=A0A2N5T9H9_9BASI|nr:hypothetical protein PCASD_17726 [Puccinia coronata f. sp. avenae]
MVSEDESHEPSLDSSEIAWQIQQYDPPSKKTLQPTKMPSATMKPKMKSFPQQRPNHQKGSTACAPQIKWYGTIPKTPNFLKKDKYEVTNHASYSNWVETAYDVSRSEIGLLLKMSNPAEAIKRAQREDLLAAQADHEEAVQIAAAKRKASNGDDDNPDADADDELDPVDWERINTHMKKIYAANLTNVKYDQHLPVYIDPTNAHRYISSPLEACQEWARALSGQKSSDRAWRLGWQ